MLTQYSPADVRAEKIGAFGKRLSKLSTTIPPTPWLPTTTSPLAQPGGVADAPRGSVLEWDQKFVVVVPTTAPASATP